MISDLSFNMLLRIMEKFHTIEPSFIHDLRPLLHEMTTLRGELLLPKGSAHKQVFFLVTGTCIDVTIHPDTGKEEINWIWFPGDFLYSTPGFFSQQPAESRIEAVDECQLLYISHHDYVQIYHSYSLVKSLVEKIRDHYYLALKRHALDLAGLSNQQRYDKFLHSHPKALLFLSHKHICSFLGIHDKGLGRYGK